MDLLRVHYIFFDTVRVGAGDLTGTKLKQMLLQLIFQQVLQQQQIQNLNFSIKNQAIFLQYQQMILYQSKAKRKLIPKHIRKTIPMKKRAKTILPNKTGMFSERKCT